MQPADIRKVNPMKPLPIPEESIKKSSLRPCGSSGTSKCAIAFSWLAFMIISHHYEAYWEPVSEFGDDDSTLTSHFLQYMQCHDLFPSLYETDNN